MGDGQAASGKSAGTEVCVLSSLPHRLRHELCDGWICHWGVSRPGTELVNCRFRFSILTTFANWRSGSSSLEVVIEGDCARCLGVLCVDLGGKTVQHNSGCDSRAEEVHIECQQLEDSPLPAESHAIVHPALEHINDDWAGCALCK